MPRQRNGTIAVHDLVGHLVFGVGRLDVLTLLPLEGVDAAVDRGCEGSFDGGEGRLGAADDALVVGFEEDPKGVYDIVGIFEERRVGGRLEDVGVFPGDFVGPGWRG